MLRVGVFVVTVLGCSIASPGARAQTTAATEGAAATPAVAPKAIGLSESGIETKPDLAAAAPESPTAFEPDIYPPAEARWRTLLLGAGLAAVGYGLAVGTSYLWEGAPGMASLRTPLVGPVWAIADGECGDAEGGCSTTTVVLRSLLAGISGLAQVGAIGVLTEGAIMSTSDAPVAARGPKWYALPTASKSGAGVCVGATF